MVLQLNLFVFHHLLSHHYLMVLLLLFLLYNDVLLHLLFVYYLKNILSISDTRSILRPLTEKFFKGTGDVDFEKIYAEIFKIEQEQSFDVTRDVVHKYRKSRKSFENLEDGEEKELLQMFSFISMLSFDVYMKKHMIGKMIDDYFSKLETNDPAKKDRDQ